MSQPFFQNQSKKPLVLVIVGVILTSLGIVMGKKPESVAAFNAKIGRGFDSVKNKFTKGSEKS